jgi:NADH dehydrogenase FAD-containing subunit
VWAAGSKPVTIPIHGLSLTPKGEYAVDAKLAVTGAQGVYAVGDNASAGTPKTAQAAVQQARQAVENIERSFKGEAGNAFVFKPRGTLIALDKDTCGLVFGKKVKGLLARTMRETYYRYMIQQYQ